MTTNNLPTKPHYDTNGMLLPYYDEQSGNVIFNMGFAREICFPPEEHAELTKLCETLLEEQKK